MVSQNLGSAFQWNLKRNSDIFIQENISEIDDCKTSAIFSGLNVLILPMYMAITVAADALAPRTWWPCALQ